MHVYVGQFLENKKTNAGFNHITHKSLVTTVQQSSWSCSRSRTSWRTCSGSTTSGCCAPCPPGIMSVGHAATIATARQYSWLASVESSVMLLFSSLSVVSGLWPVHGKRFVRIAIEDVYLVDAEYPRYCDTRLSVGSGDWDDSCDNSAGRGKWGQEKGSRDGIGSTGIAAPRGTRLEFFRRKSDIFFLSSWQY